MTKLMTITRISVQKQAAITNLRLSVAAGSRSIQLHLMAFYNENGMVNAANRERQLTQG
jgi:hypothetical protein